LHRSQPRAGVWTSGVCPASNPTGITDNIKDRNAFDFISAHQRQAEGNTVHGVNRKPCPDPARSVCMPGSLSYGSSEISSVSSANGLDGTGKVVDHNPVVNADEKSDTPIVPQMLPNKGVEPAEATEGRGVIGGNAFETRAWRTQSQIKYASMGIEGVREAAKRNPKMRFTALMHHITPALLVKSFHALRKQAASGVDGVTWYVYEKTFEGRVQELHREIQSGAYRAQPSRRVYIPKSTSGCFVSCRIESVTAG